MVEMTKKLKKYGVAYQRTKILVPYPRNPRRGVCQICGRSVKKREIKTTQLHHWTYAYETKTVKKNPLLALENTIEVCYGCHKICDWLRDATTGTRPENFYRIIDVGRHMPDWMQDRFTKICKLWLKWVRNGKK